MRQATLLKVRIHELKQHVPLSPHEDDNTRKAHRVKNPLNSGGFDSRAWRFWPWMAGVQKMQEQLSAETGKLQGHSECRRCREQVPAPYINNITATNEKAPNAMH